MKTIDDFLKIIKEDEEIQKLLNGSEELKRDYKPRTRQGRSKSRSTKSGIALDYFWDGIDGIKFRVIMENKYDVDLGNTRLVGKLRTALHLYLAEVIEK